MASTFLGGSQGKEDRPHALAVDTKGIVYVVLRVTFKHGPRDKG